MYRDRERLQLFMWIDIYEGIAPGFELTLLQHWVVDYHSAELYPK